MTATIRRREDLAAQDLDGDIVMADIHAGQFYGLGDSARRIWDLLDQPKTPAQLCDNLMQEYEVERAECERDVQEFLGELLAAGLIRIDT